MSPAQGWGYRLRVKSSLRVIAGDHQTTLAEHVTDRRPYLTNVALTQSSDFSSSTSHCRLCGHPNRTDAFTFLQNTHKILLCSLNKKYYL